MGTWVHEATVALVALACVGVVSVLIALWVE